MSKFDLDRIDVKILSALQLSGRISNKDLADKVGLSPSPCLVRVRRLEKAGIIKRYVAQIDLRKIAGSISVITQLYLHDSDVRSSKNLEAYLLSLPQTVDLFDVNGECDYIMKFVCRGTEDYYAIARTLLESESFKVRQISSYIILREIRSFQGCDLAYMLDGPR